MKDQDHRIVDYCQAVWGIKPESLAPIVAAIRARRLGQIEAYPVEAVEQIAAVSSRSGLRTTGGVAVIGLKGVIRPTTSLLSLIFGFGGAGLDVFRSQLRSALSDDDIGSILIDVDSPGGLTDLVAETAAEVHAARGKKPIVAIANTMAASAAYWIASQADELVVTPSGEVGSIGCLAIHDEFSQMDEAMGITTTIIRQPERKGEGNPYEPLTDEAQASIQERVDDIAQMFVKAVAKGRGVSVAKVNSDFGQGTMVLNDDAIEAGMVDAVETFEDAVQRLAEGRTVSGGTRVGAAAPAIVGEDGPVTLTIGGTTLTLSTSAAIAAGNPPDDDAAAAAPSDDEPAADDEPAGDDEPSGDDDDPAGLPDDDDADTDPDDEPEADDAEGDDDPDGGGDEPPTEADAKRAVADLLFST